MDAIIAERLTASPRIYNIYGHCGLGILSEFFPYGNLEEYAVPEGDGYLDAERVKEAEKNGLESFNDLSPIVKLKSSLHMAEALADLHGYKFGVMVHQDVQ
jgi:hypothetical protein